MSLFKRVIKAFKNIFKTSVKKSRKSQKVSKKAKRSAYSKKSSVKRKSLQRHSKTKQASPNAKSSVVASKNFSKSSVKAKTIVQDKKKFPSAVHVGSVTHYFDKIKVCVIRLDQGILKKGDKVLIKGIKGSLTQIVHSMQIENEDVPVARKGQLIGLKVTKQVYVGDSVGKL